MQEQPIKNVTFAPIEIDNTLWTAEDIGHYLKMSTFTVQTRVAVKPDFPTPIIPANGSKRWLATEVIKWAKQQRR